MSQGNADQQLGDLSARVRILEASQLRMEARIERQLAELAETVTEMRDAMNAAKGGWRMLIVIGSIVAGLGAVAGWTLNLVFGRH